MPPCSKSSLAFLRWNTGGQRIWKIYKSKAGILPLDSKVPAFLVPKNYLVNQFILNDFLCLRFQRGSSAHPAHGVEGFQFLGDARRLHHAGSMASIRSRAALVKSRWRQIAPTGSFFAAVRRSGYRAVSSRRASFFSPRPDARPHAAAVDALDPGNLAHRHAQVKPGIDAPGLDGGQLHQPAYTSSRSCFCSRISSGVSGRLSASFSMPILPVQRIMSLMPVLPAFVGGIVLLLAPDRGQDFLSHVHKTSVLYVSGYRSRRLIFCMMYLRFNSLVDG